MIGRELFTEKPMWKLKLGRAWGKMLSKYMPHQGEREIARRKKQQAKEPCK